MKDEESISYFVSTEQLQWIVFAHFTLNETGKTLKGLNGWRSGGQGWGWGILLTLTSPSQIPGHESVSSVTQLRAITSILSPRVFMTLLSWISSLKDFHIKCKLIYASSNSKFNWSSNKSLFVEYCYQQNCASYTANNKL